MMRSRVAQKRQVSDGSCEQKIIYISTSYISQLNKDETFEAETQTEGLSSDVFVSQEQVKQ